MATIEPVKKTVVQEMFVMTFERSELEEVLSDPTLWLRDIRHALNGKAMPPLKRANGRANGHAKERANGKAAKGRGGRASTRARPNSKSGDGPYKCEHCHREFARKGNRDNHQAECTDNIDVGTYQPAASGSD